MTIRKKLELLIVTVVMIIATYGVFQDVFTSRDATILIGIAIALFEGTDIAEIIKGGG